MKYLLGSSALLIGMLGLGCSDQPEAVTTDTTTNNIVVVNAITDDDKSLEISGKVATSANDVSLDTVYPKKPSAWKSKVVRHARNTLSSRSYEVLVVPFQSTDEEFGSTTRSLFTLSTAELINQGFGLGTPDITTVNEALGINEFEFDLENIKELGSTIQAKSLVVGKIQHNNSSKFNVELILYTKDVEKTNASLQGYSESARVERNGLSFNAEQLPIYAYSRLLDELLEELFNRKSTTINVESGVLGKLELTGEIEEYFQYNQSNPLESAQRAQLLGLLHPVEITERYGRILYEKSFVDLMRIQNPSDEILLMRAEALLSLNRRPAALAVLESTSDSAEKNALLQYAMGNVVERATIELIVDPIKRISAHIRNQRLRNRYDLIPDNRVFDDIELPDLWKGLFYNAFVDGHVWRDTGSDYLKAALDKISPNVALLLPAVELRQALSSKRADGNTVEQATFSHIESIRKKSSPRNSAPNILDFIDLVQSQLIENVHDKIWKEVWTRGNIEYGGELVETHEPHLLGQPDFMLVSTTAYGEWSRLSGLPDMRLRQLREKFVENGVQGFLHADRSQPRATEYNNTLNKINEMTPENIAVVRGIARWPLSCRPAVFYAARNDLKECADNSISDFDAFRDYIARQDHETQRKQLDKNYNRFTGHESRLSYFYEKYSRLGDSEGLDKVSQELMQSGNTDWALLKRIADTARLNSKFDDAADIVLSYPELKNNKNISNVKASNRSFSIGSRMYWAGAHEAAARLFEMTVSRDTGSAAEMSANARLATIQGDYETAAYFQYERIQRYRDRYAMRDLLGLISIMMDGEKAMQFANSLAPFLDKAQVWHGTLIAHRASGATLDEQFHWASDYGINFDNNMSESEIQIQIPVQRQKNRFIFMASVVDRIIDAPTIKKMDQYYGARTQSAIIPRHSGGKAAIEWQIDHKNWWNGDYNTIKEYIVASRHLTASKALRLLYNSEFEAAESLLTEELLCHGRAVEFLWICAWAAGENGTHEDMIFQLEEYITTKNETLSSDDSDPKGSLFDQHVALAMLHGFNNQAERAIKLFKLSNADHLYTEDRSLFVRYQLLEAIRVLYEHSSDIRYRDLLLELAGDYTIVDPIAAYNYSFIAMLSDDRDARVSALAKLFKMDLNSRALLFADDNELESAKKIAGAINNSNSEDTGNEGI